MYLALETNSTKL